MCVLITYVFTCIMFNEKTDCLPVFAERLMYWVESELSQRFRAVEVSLKCKTKVELTIAPKLS